MLRAEPETAPAPQLLFALPPSWNLEQLTSLAVQNHPDLAAAQARVQAARGQLLQAGLYPNPLVGPRFGELGHNDNAMGEPGFRVTQTLVTGHKLRIAKAAAAFGVQAADWQVMTRWFEVVTRLRKAYFEVLTAQREVETTRDIVRLSEEGLAVAQKLHKAGAGNVPDILRAQVELDKSQVLLGVAQRRQEAAWRLLSTAVGRPLPPGEVAGTLETPTPPFAWSTMVATVQAGNSQVQETLAFVAQAEQLLRRARREVIPNVDVQAQPFYVTYDKEVRVAASLTAAVPLFNRNQGNILTAEGELARSHAQVRQVELRLTEQLAVAFKQFQTAQQRVEAFRQRILPNAREALRLVRLGYVAGDPKYDYTAVLQAQQVLFQAQLTYVQALGDLWREVAELTGLLQVETLPPV